MGKKSKNSNNIRRTVISEAPPYLQAAEISDLEMAESTEPVPDPDPEDISEAIPEAAPELVPELDVQAAPEPDPKPIPNSAFEAAPQLDPKSVSNFGREEIDKAAEEASAKQHEVTDAPATRANKAPEPVSKRAEVTTEAPTILPEPVIIKYNQPNIR
ncbi:hypothetical protein Aspvir_001607 [Aspergillus viridinutans]|uniref:Uncharacterized protein n=1 Tax=Aspergillus viridinutans TaxID=75553 RepID=A0A9P3BT32_ASPVI|nr:uncharacterized protein Aspvir_001607 [Aspergillus viridinutans]GIJ99475.1 hypothetical protein Aspvir_001607 [Aspergillus viridinutans]